MAFRESRRCAEFKFQAHISLITGNVLFVKISFTKLKILNSLYIIIPSQYKFTAGEHTFIYRTSSITATIRRLLQIYIKRSQFVKYDLLEHSEACRKV